MTSGEGFFARPFIRAYMNSKAVEGLDADYDRMQWAGKQHVFEEVMEEAGFRRERFQPCRNK